MLETVHLLQFRKLQIRLLTMMLQMSAEEIYCTPCAPDHKQEPFLDISATRHIWTRPESAAGSQYVVIATTTGLGCTWQISRRWLRCETCFTEVGSLNPVKCLRRSLLLTAPWLGVLGNILLQVTVFLLIYENNFILTASLLQQ